MQLDKTKIAIRQRSWLELLDLSLIVLREYWGPLTRWSLFGALPFTLLNTLILFPLHNYDALILGAPVDWTIEMLHARYIFLLISLVFLEAPLALLGATYYLGQAVFIDRPSRNEVMNALRRRSIEAFIALGIIRMGLAGLVVAFIIGWIAPYSALIDIVVLGIGLVGCNMLIRAIRPFAPEILILEQCPLRVRPGTPGISYQKRLHGLHTVVSSELIGQYLLIASVFTVTACILTVSEMSLLGFFFDRWEWGWWMDLVFVPINLWLLAIWATIYRFLSYLDTRIRLEGWEVELRFRAEAQRLETLLSS